MTDAFRVLGLAPTADERAIKRAYAALLRVHRPDEDPVGFQRINEAYAGALEACRRRAAGALAAPEAPAPDDIGPDGAREGQREALRAHALEPTPPVEATDAVPASPRDDRWDISAELQGETYAEQRAALDMVLDVARRGRVRALEEHLRGAFTYWTIDAKRQLAWQLLDRLAKEPVAMPGDGFDALMAFFGLDDVHAVRDARHLDLLREECMQWWQLRRRPSSHSRRTPEDRADNAYHAMINRLHGPFSWWTTPWQALRPSAGWDVGRFLHSIRLRIPSRLPPGIDPATIAFWANLLALDPPINRARLTVFTLRTLIGAAALALLAMLIATDVDGPASQVALEGFGYGVMIALAWLALQVYNRWQGLRGPFEWPAWLVPGLALATFASIPFAVDGTPTQALSGLTLLLPLWRDLHAWMRRRGSAAYDMPSVGSGLMLWMATSTVFVSMTRLLDWVPAVAGLALWAWQLWRIRKAHARA